MKKHIALLLVGALVLIFSSCNDPSYITPASSEAGGDSSAPPTETPVDDPSVSSFEEVPTEPTEPTTPTEPSVPPTEPTAPTEPTEPDGSQTGPGDIDNGLGWG